MSKRYSQAFIGLVDMLVRDTCGSSCLQRPVPAIPPVYPSMKSHFAVMIIRRNLVDTWTRRLRELCNRNRERSYKARGEQAIPGELNEEAQTILNPVCIASHNSIV